MTTAKMQACAVWVGTRSKFVCSHPSSPPTDIDECESARGGCGQLCNNTIGSFFCDCMSGYSLDEDQSNCSGLLCVCVYVGSRHLHCLQTLMSVLMTH